MSDTPIGWFDPNQPLHMAITDEIKKQWEQVWPEQAAKFSNPLFGKSLGYTAGYRDGCNDSADWLRDNYQYYPNIDSLIHALREACRPQ